MATAKPPPAPPANRLLAGLPPADYRRLLPRLEAVGLPHRQVLYPPGGPVDYVYFPSRGVVSVVAVLADRRTIEVGLCGPEGAVGVYWSADGSCATASPGIASASAAARALPMRALVVGAGCFKLSSLPRVGCSAIGPVPPAIALLASGKSNSDWDGKLRPEH